jgi:hypothetical protein
VGELEVEVEASRASEMEVRIEKSGSGLLRAVSLFPLDISLSPGGKTDVGVGAGYGYFLLGLIGNVAYVLEVVGIYLDAGS